VQAAFASGAVEGKLAMSPAAVGGGDVPPLAVAAFRMLGAAAFFAAAGRAFGVRWRLGLREHAALVGLSLLGVVVNQTLFLAGLRLTSAVNAALLGVTIPVFTAAIAVLVGHERGHRRMWAGLALAAAGVLYLTGIHEPDRGVVLVAVNSLSYALYVVFARRAITRLGAGTVVAWVYVWAVALFVPFAAPTMIDAMPGMNARGWVLCAYIVAVPTILAYGLNAWALGRARASVVTVFVFLQPVLAALLAWAQLGQTPPPRTAVAALLIGLGVSLVSWRRG